MQHNILYNYLSQLTTPSSEMAKVPALTPLSRCTSEELIERLDATSRRLEVSEPGLPALGAIDTMRALAGHLVIVHFNDAEMLKAVRRLACKLQTMGDKHWRIHREEWDNFFGPNAGPPVVPALHKVAWDVGHRTRSD